MKYTLERVGLHLPEISISTVIWGGAHFNSDLRRLMRAEAPPQMTVEIFISERRNRKFRLQSCLSARLGALRSTTPMDHYSPSTASALASSKRNFTRGATLLPSAHPEQEGQFSRGNEHSITRKSKRKPLYSIQFYYFIYILLSQELNKNYT